MDHKQALAKARELLPQGARLLYLTEFGSRLYGTNTPESDYDFHGIYLPSMQDMLLQKKAPHVHFSTGDKENKNTSEDCDIQLWSLQYWLLNLIKKHKESIAGWSAHVTNLTLARKVFPHKPGGNSSLQWIIGG